VNCALSKQGNPEADEEAAGYAWTTYSEAENAARNATPPCHDPFVSKARAAYDEALRDQ
jgi:hypothetical protein